MKHDLLGRTVTDRITGFSGVVGGVVNYLSGCVQALVLPKCGEDGKLPESQWFDVQRLQATNAEPLVLINEATPGFEKPAPRR